MYVDEAVPHMSDDLGDTVSYSDVVRGIGALALSDRHTQLIETVAERVAALALADPRVKRAVVAVEKPDVYAHVGAVGVRIERWRGRAAGQGAA
jgi:dihydroneopterin aldolase